LRKEELLKKNNSLSTAGFDPAPQALRACVPTPVDLVVSFLVPLSVSVNNRHEHWVRTNSPNN